MTLRPLMTFLLIYVVGAECDPVSIRTNYRHETVDLYRLNASADDARRLLLIYLVRINELADRPQFYHLLTNSCTQHYSLCKRSRPGGSVRHPPSPQRFDR